MIKKFLKYVEIQTKITSVYAMLNAILFMILNKKEIDLSVTVVFVIAAFIFDLTTTAINNYIDSKDYPEMLPLNRKLSFVIIITMLAISTIMGLYLAYRGGILVLLIGGLCFLLGIFYTFGPLPISRIPLGELFSGIAYGMLIPFLMFYLNTPDDYIRLDLSLEAINIKFMVWPLVSFLIYSLVTTFTTSNIMLANNTCDLEKDVAVNRHTLVFYIGRKAAVNLYAILYYLCYVAVILMVITKVLPVISLIFVLSFPLVQKNINIFRAEQIKAKTFITSIRNFIIINTAFTISLIAGIIFSL
ncbi:1,4-dihydroxy-2-naphthoate octaprenyltransferase [Butyrivibrio fibrisolvens 16/4]|nr:1,4-dihydroxy-2-naphthoate octaprenyltransferase [Butyrivibrio fibrisolvens 16/4]